MASWKCAGQCLRWGWKSCFSVQACGCASPAAEPSFCPFSVVLRPRPSVWGRDLADQAGACRALWVQSFGSSSSALASSDPSLKQRCGVAGPLAFGQQGLLCGGCVLGETSLTHAAGTLYGPSLSGGL